MSADEQHSPNKTVRTGIPKGARLLHLYQPGEVMHNGQIAEGKEPKEKRGHHDAVPQDMFLDYGVGTNIGIALDNQFILVDFDTTGPLVERECLRLPPAWRQQTVRGQHHLFTVPDGWKGRNLGYYVKDDTGRQVKIGDIKTKGYLVGPGSYRNTGSDGGFIYAVLDDRQPPIAPDWLLELAADRVDDFSVIIDGEAAERERIEYGRNDEELTRIAGFLRHRGFTAPAITTMLHGIIDSGILEQDESRPYTLSDAQRIARSASKWQPGEQTPEILVKPEAWLCAADMALIERPVEWWLHRFVPKGELALVYGEGGIGKSSWVSWLAALVTKAGGTFVHVGVEEPFRTFALRAVQHGADRSKLFSIPGGASLQFPRDAAALADALQTAQASFMYFDSIYTHFEREKGSNAAERARQSLSPLADLAQRLGITVMGTFHENKAGDYLGSVEMRNVCRCLLRASRQPGKPLRISVEKTNHSDPDYHLEYEGIETVAADPLTGEIQREILDDGSVVPLTMMLPGEPVKVNRSSVSFDEIRDSMNDERAQERAGKAEQARELKSQGLTLKEIASELGVSQRTIERYLKTDSDIRQTGVI